MRLIPLFFLFAISTGALGQTKTYVGFKAGGQINSAYMVHNAFRFRMNNTFKSGINSGFTIKHFPKKRDTFFNTGIQGGVNFMQRGWIQSFKGTGIANYSVGMNYLEFPIEGIGYFGNKTKYFIGGGFYAEYLLSSSKDDDPFDRSDPNFSTLDFATYEEDRDRKGGYGARFSGGVFRDFPFGSLHLEGFFTYSFSNFIDAGDLTNDQLPNISNLWSLGLSVGYFISFGKLEMVK